MLVCWRKNVEDFKFKSLLLRKSRLCVSKVKKEEEENAASRIKKSSSQMLETTTYAAKCGSWCSKKKRRKFSEERKAKKTLRLRKNGQFSLVRFLSSSNNGASPIFTLHNVLRTSSHLPNPLGKKSPDHTPKQLCHIFPIFTLTPHAFYCSVILPSAPPNDPHLSLSDMEESCHEYPPHIL